MSRTRSLSISLGILVGLCGSLGAQADFLRGDCNVDAGFDVGDPVFLLGNLFSMGPSSSCEDACDINDDGTLNIADPVYGLGFLFTSGPPPPPPFGTCGPDPTPDTISCVSFPPCSAVVLSHAIDIQPIWTANCIICHSQPLPPEGLDLTAGTAYGLLVDVPSMECPSFDRIEPGDASQSWLFRKITGTQADQDVLGMGCTIMDVGAPMPLLAAPLPPATIDLIQQWIESGANP